MSEWTKEPQLWSAYNNEIMDNIKNVVGLMYTKENARQVVAEHNALSGIPDPAAAIEAAREALVALVKDSDSQCWDCGECPPCKGRAALALIEGKKHG